MPRSSMEAAPTGMDTPESMRPVGVPRSTGHRFYNHGPRDPISPCSLPRVSFQSPQGPSPQTWMPYAPYGFSPVSQFGPVTPHINPGMMYSSFIPSPVYHGMYPDFVAMMSPSASAGNGRTSADGQPSRSAGSGDVASERHSFDKAN